MILDNSFYKTVLIFWAHKLYLSKTGPKTKGDEPYILFLAISFSNPVWLIAASSPN